MMRKRAAKEETTAICVACASVRSRMPCSPPCVLGTYVLRLVREQTRAIEHIPRPPVSGGNPEA